MRNRNCSEQSLLAVEWLQQLWQLHKQETGFKLCTCPSPLCMLFYRVTSPSWLCIGAPHSASVPIVRG